jgi:hypothetical protein
MDEEIYQLLVGMDRTLDRIVNLLDNMYEVLKDIRDNTEGR